MDIFLVTNDTTGNLEMIFGDEMSAAEWIYTNTKTGDNTYSISVEEMC